MFLSIEISVFMWVCFLFRHTVHCSFSGRGAGISHATTASNAVCVTGRLAILPSIIAIYSSEWVLAYVNTPDVAIRY
jgi:hypothetical protein